jgi:hypothetical protein
MNRYALPPRVSVRAALVMGLSVIAQAAPCSPTPMFYSDSNDGTYMTITKRGNITRFMSPANHPPSNGVGYDHIGRNTPNTSSEGDVLCNHLSQEIAYDVGDNGQFGFALETSNCFPEAITITRNILDDNDVSVLQKSIPPLGTLH